MLAFGRIQNLYVGNTPQVVELVKIANGNDPVGWWQIRVILKASEVEVSGGIGFELANELRRVLDAQPARITSLE